MKKLSTLKLAEKNVINNAKYWVDMMRICDALSIVGNNACHDHIGKKKFFDGLILIRSSMHDEMVNALSNCFIFAGVGGKEVSDFSRERFGELFKDDQKSLKNCIMYLLEYNCQMPHSWKSEEEEQLRKEANEKNKSFKKPNKKRLI